MKDFSNRNCEQLALPLTSPIEDCEGWWLSGGRSSWQLKTGTLSSNFQLPTFSFPSYQQTFIYSCSKDVLI